MQANFSDVEDKFKQELADCAINAYNFSASNHSLFKQSQQEAFQGFTDGLNKGEKHGYIELPTGVGKTALFISFIENYLKAANDSPDAPRVLIAVPTEKLAVQTAKSFAKFMPDIAQTIETDGDMGEEIDWANSDIGLQYSKMKHADKKPKVLITTYQSLARDTANKVYPPNEYGFVIYDEGHSITAPSFGKAVEKFKDSVQLAVTATPEYTEQKTVASKLPHRYFKLSLAEAINRGDLCNVRPALLKTGYTIDEALFQKFMEQQGGTPLNDNQLQQLLNQEARNEAVVKTYLLGSDKDSGERYLGQNGMVFCAGIKHADQMVKQFKEAVEHDGTHKLQNWLNDENVELIASVHGGQKGAWLKKGLLEGAENRTYQGTKEWYSEDEIFKLHDAGKILLLASVAKLKWGYDCPRDSLLFDLADRFSKVDATQIDGRAFRLDPENSDKTATVFNLMDENTEAIYAKYPKLIPIYCAEVIEGANFRPPAKRVGLQRFKEPPPEMAQSLQDAGFEVISSFEETGRISRRNKEVREKKAPPKTYEWLNIKEMSREIGKSPNTLQPIYSGMIEAWKTAKKEEEEAFSFDSLTIPIDKAGFFGIQSSFCLHESEATNLRNFIDSSRTKEKTSEWLGMVQMATITGYGDKRMTPIYKSLEAAWKTAVESGEKTFSAEGLTLPTDKAGFFRSDVRRVFCLHQDIAPLFSERKLEKSDKWLGVKNMAVRTKIAAATISPIYRSLQTAWEEAVQKEEKTFGIEGLTIPTDKAGFFGRMNTFCLDEEMSDLLKQYIKTPKAPEKTEEWFAPSDMTKATKKQSSDISAIYQSLENAWKPAKEAKEEIFYFEGVSIPTDKAGLFQNPARRVAFCLHESLADTVTSMIESQKKAQKAGTFAEMVGREKTSIAPDQIKETITGRVRTGGS